jgi:hypothetical protein
MLASRIFQLVTYEIDAFMKQRETGPLLDCSSGLQLHVMLELHKKKKGLVLGSLYLNTEEQGDNYSYFFAMVGS